MKYFLSLVVFLSCIPLVAQNPEGKQSMHEWLIQDTKMLESLHPMHPIVVVSDFPQKDVNSNIDVLSYHVSMDWVYALLTDSDKRSGRRSSSNVKMSIVVLATSLDSVKLNSVNLQIDSIVVNSVRAGHRSSGGSLSVSLNGSVAQGDTVDVQIWYGVFTDRRGFWAFSKADAASFELPEAIAFTFSQPENSRYFFPCNDVPFDKAIFTGSARVPTGYTMVSNGTMQDSVVDSDTTLWFTWHHPVEMPTYLFSMAASKFMSYYQEYVRNGTDTIPIYNYHWEVDHDDTLYNAVNALRNIPEMFKAFESYFGDYPFPTYGHVTVAPIQFGGMEHQSMSMINRRWLQGDVELGYAHELGHQWLGDLVTCATWADIWLNEGAASYSEALWAGHQYGPAEFDAVLRRKRNRYMQKGLAEPAIYNIPLSILFNEATTYNKSAWVYHMMNHQVGDAAFFSALRSYMDKYYVGSAQTYQMLEFWKEVMPNPVIDWDVFFDQWLVKAGHPILVANLVTDSVPNATMKYKNLLTIQQTQVAPNVPEVFEIPITVRLVGTTDSTEVKLVLKNRSMEYSTLTDFLVKSIVIDPNNEVLCEKITSVITDVEEHDKGSIALIGQMPLQTGSALYLQAPVGSTVKLVSINGTVLSSVRTVDTISLIETAELESGVLYIVVQNKDTLKTFSTSIIR